MMRINPTEYRMIATLDKKGRVYDRRKWRRIGRLQLEREPLCRMCDAIGVTRAAKDVDHIRAIADGGDPWDFSNLRSLCHECHSRVTRAWQQGKPAPGAHV